MTLEQQIKNGLATYKEQIATCSEEELLPWVSEVKKALLTGNDSLVSSPLWLEWVPEVYKILKEELQHTVSQADSN